MTRMRWKPVKHPRVLEGYMISQFGDIKAENSPDGKSFKADYHASNGYDFALMLNAEENLQLFPIDEIIASAFITPPDELIGKPSTVLHINGDTHDISLDNLKWVEDIEEWKTVTYPKIKPNMYEVSSWGRLRRIGSDEFKVLVPQKRGYLSSCFRASDGGTYTKMIHRLVLYHFSYRDDYMNLQVNHIDGDKSNNSLKNLEWCDQLQNQKHAMLMELKNTGNKQCSDELVKHIWMLLIDDESYLKGRVPTKGSSSRVLRYLHEDLGHPIERQFVDGIKFRKRYKYITNKLPQKDFDPYPIGYGKSSLSEDDVRLIWLLLIDDPDTIGDNKPTNGSPQKVHDILLTKGLNVSPGAILCIKKKRAWKYITDQLPDKKFELLSHTGKDSIATPEIVKLIWLLLINDPSALKNDSPTNGSPKKVREILMSRGINNINDDMISAIKHKRNWSSITDELPPGNFE